MKAIFLGLTLVSLCGCEVFQAGSQTDSVRGPRGSWGHKVEIVTSEPGSKIEINKEYVGDSPLTVTLFGDKDGTFRGGMDYRILAYPVKPGQYLQTMSFTGGGGGLHEERVPKRIYFDLMLQRAPEKKEIKVDVTTEDKTPKSK